MESLRLFDPTEDKERVNRIFYGKDYKQFFKNDLLEIEDPQEPTASSDPVLKSNLLLRNPNPSNLQIEQQQEIST